jgi:hypothetical protein
MFPGQQYYPESRFRPERGMGHSWHVWCDSGALEVLQKKEYLTLAMGEQYLVNFANGSAARISPEAPLWQKLAEIAKTHTVEVFPLGLFSKKYIPWTGDAGSLDRFDAICITAK